MAKTIDARNLTRIFGDTTAVDNISFSVDEGEIFGLLGPNGAGKTTTIRMLCCLISPTSGSAIIGGYNIADREGAMNIRRMIGLVPDNVGLYETLSAYDNLEFFGKMYELPDGLRRENVEKYLKLVDLWDKRDRAVGSFSKGMKQKVAIVRALIHDPKVLLMDKPTVNLDPEAAKGIRDLILQLRKDGRTVLINTHNLDEAQRMCDRIGVLKTKLIAVDTPQNLERAISGTQTVVVLEEVNDDILNAIKAVNPKDIKRDGNKLIIDVNNPEKETPVIINAIVSAGGKVISANRIGASLEEVYLKLVKE
ncbi:MAG: ABC transporter ATP-binding protein [Nitrososphaerota archaeon]|nr:ABC transporter ATP-binding protein [Nitrososphaerota archaeon]MDG7048941.1 ABC transporter ATP-binding protein [Nitrososphaerota archaeon]MDG7051946.1 ABC transporter ATP-binding protein [Nitrososphaerota archaeon]